MKTVGHTRERCLLVLRDYWDEMDTLLDDLERLDEAGADLRRGCEVQLAQLLRDLRGDIDVRRSAGAIVRMTEVEAGTFLPVLRAVLAQLSGLPERPDASWVAALGAAQALLQEASRGLSRSPVGAGLGALAIASA